MTRTSSLLIALLVGAVSVVATPGPAQARPTCSGTSGMCTWEVAQDAETGDHFFGLSCAGETMWQPIDDATACDLCCPRA